MAPPRSRKTTYSYAAVYHLWRRCAHAVTTEGHTEIHKYKLFGGVDFGEFTCHEFIRLEGQEWFYVEDVYYEDVESKGLRPEFSLEIRTHKNRRQDNLCAVR